MSAMKNNQQIQHEYDAWHAGVHASDPGHDDASAPWYQLVREHLPALEGRRVLEVACGRGGFLLALWRRGAQVFGADFSHTALRLAQARDRREHHNGAAIHLLQADAHRLPYADASFDIIVSCETIEHLDNPVAALVEMARVSRPAGRLLLTTPNFANLMGLYHVYKRLRTGSMNSSTNQPVEHAYCFWQVRGFLRRAGWRILRADGTVHSFPFPGRNPVRVQFLERSPGLRRALRAVALHYFLLAEKAPTP
jgi:ubiquinone/menaquinone biosynthesis C-methylase UbiE